MSSAEYILRRAAISVVLILAVATFLFFVFRLMPGDYVTFLLGEGASPETAERLRQKWGLNEPLHVQYVQYMVNLFTGDAGSSKVTGQPVVQFVLPRLANSLILVLPAILTAFVLGSLYGAVLGTQEDSLLERYGIFPPTLIGTTPDFFIGIVVLFIFSAWLNLFPPSGMVSPGTRELATSHWDLYLTTDFLYHYTLPFLAVTLKYMYYPALVMRGSVVEVSGQEFSVYHKMVGLGALTRFKHIMQHASLPVVTLLPAVTATAISGLVLIEVVFNWPGIGLLVYDSILTRDMAVIQFVFLLIAIWIILGNFIVDIVYTLIDPRITYEEG